MISPISPKRNALSLFLYFTYLGALTFGTGGLFIIMQIERDLVERRGWLTRDELWDMYSVGRSLPGMMVSNVVFIFAYGVCGLAGALASLIGMYLAPFISIMFVTYMYTSFSHNFCVAAIFEGIRAIVLPVVTVALLSMWKGAFKHRAGYLIAAASFALFMYGAGVIEIVVGSGVCGLIIGRYAVGAPKDGEPA